MIFKMDGFKRVLGAGARALVTATSALGAPEAQARVDVGIGLAYAREAVRRRAILGRARLSPICPTRPATTAQDGTSYPTATLLQQYLMNLSIERRDGVDRLS